MVSIILKGKVKGSGANTERERSRPHHNLLHAISGVRSRGVTPIIGEIKPRSPSAGVLRPDVDVGQLVGEMEGADAAGISILTEGTLFGGSPELLLEASKLAGVPLLRKDFLVTQSELEESEALGADAVLLIVRLLGDRLRSMYDRALDLGLTPLVEVHDEAEMEMASSLDPVLIGVNNRNLEDFTIDLQTTARLAPMAPRGCTVVSESGFLSREDILRVEPHCDAFLVGSALMTGCPGRRLLELQGRGE